MATVTNTTEHGEAIIHTWTPLTETNSDGLPVKLIGSGDRTIQVTGTFGGGTIILEGSLDGTNYFQLKDPSSTNISFTAAGLKAVLEGVTWIRPRVTAGTGVSLTAKLMTRRAGKVH